MSENIQDDSKTKKKGFKFFLKFFFGIFIVTIVMSLFGIGFVDTNNGASLAQFQAKLQNNEIYFLLVRIGLASLIFYKWDSVVNWWVGRSKRKYAQKEIDYLKQHGAQRGFTWYVIAELLFGIELLSDVAGLIIGWVF